MKTHGCGKHLLRLDKVWKNVYSHYMITNKHLQNLKKKTNSIQTNLSRA